MRYQVFISVSFIALAFASCKKDDSSTASNSSNNTTAGFTWTEDAGAVNTADSAFWTTYTGGAGIRAYKGGMSNFFEINFPNSNLGSLSLAAGLTYLKGSSTITSTSGTINITSNAADKLSGSGAANVSGTGLTSISFTFTALPKR